MIDKMLDELVRNNNEFISQVEPFYKNWVDKCKMITEATSNQIVDSGERSLTKLHLFIAAIDAALEDFDKKFKDLKLNSAKTELEKVLAKVKDKKAETKPEA